MKTLTPKAQATREKIIQAANNLFYRHGYTATGLDKIIKAAEVTKGNFYYHFKSKEELLVAVLDWHRNLAFNELGLNQSLECKSPIETLLTSIKNIAKRMADTPAVQGCESPQVHGCFFGNIALELSTCSEVVRHKVKLIFDDYRGFITELLKKAKIANEIDQTLDIQTTANIIISLMEGATLLDKAEQKQSHIYQAIEFIEMYLKD